jgi:uncharacterized membrane protein
MTTLVKLIVAICLAIMTGQNDPQTSSDGYEGLAYAGLSKEDPIEERAFTVLTNKCNFCHEKRNRRRVFTEDNMNGWSNDVYKQVFIKKRMPKGKKIKLTSEEYQDLLTWISSIKNNENGNQL